MKIAILVPFFPPKWRGGVENSTYKIAKCLAERGHEVNVVTSLDEGFPKKNMEQGFFIHRTRYPRIKLIGTMIFWLGILLILRRIKPDVVQAQTVVIALPALLTRKLQGKPYYIWGRGSEIYLPWLFKNQVSKLLFKYANKVIALTEDMRREIQKIYFREVLVIPNGIDLGQFKNVLREDARRQLKITDEQKIIMFIGRLHPVKGLEYLIKAMELLKDKNKNAGLVLVGSGEEKEYLEILSRELDLEKDIRFLGSVTSEEIPHFMMASDVFVLPSLSEGFPNVILEAMACGLPIVATKVGGLPEIIEDSENGFLIAPKNPRQIAEKILLLLENDPLREKMAKNNQEKVKKYSWDNIVDRLEEIYQTPQ